jgi:hypothetical protein
MLGDSEELYVSGCALPAAQSQTLMGRWPVLPIPLAVGSDPAFSEAEISEIQAAADAWNRFFSASLGVEVFSYSDGGGFSVSSESRPQTSSLCAYGLIAGSTYTGRVVIYKATSWPSNTQNAIAVTSVCRAPETPLYRSYMGVMDLNYQYFFSQGRKQPDLRSIVIHELGHLLGLDHSCTTGASEEGFPSCSESNIDPDYLSAVMFPSVSFSAGGQGEVRRSLNGNDQGRANCLYEDIAPSFGGFTR